MKQYHYCSKGGWHWATKGVPCRRRPKPKAGKAPGRWALMRNRLQQLECQLLCDQSNERCAFQAAIRELTSALGVARERLQAAEEEAREMRALADDVAARLKRERERLAT